MSATITRADVVAGHDGRAEILVEITYDNGGTATISLEEEACAASLDAAGVGCMEDLIGSPWSVVLPAITGRAPRSSGTPSTQGEKHVGSRHP